MWMSRTRSRSAPGRYADGEGPEHFRIYSALFPAWNGATENTDRVGITGEVDYFEGQIQGTLTNQFPYPIENATLVLYGNMVQIGRMEPGETKNLADYELLRYPLGDSYLAAEHISGEDAYASRGYPRQKLYAGTGAFQPDPFLSR